VSGVKIALTGINIYDAGALNGDCILNFTLEPLESVFELIGQHLGTVWHGPRLRRNIIVSNEWCFRLIE